MININGQIYDGVMIKPELDDALKHYGVLGMKWGIRKDLRKTGSISKKTKGKINKAVSKASYGKTRRMLNGLEDLKADYTGEREMARSKKNKSGMKKNSSNINSVSQISDSVKKSANKKGYGYDKIKATRPTIRSKRNALAGNLLFGLSGSAGTAVYGGARHYGHMKKYNTNASPYFVRNTDYYKKKRK